MDEQQIAALRADTAGCEDVVHFNNAGSSLPPKPVVEAMVDYLRTEERIGGYEVAAARLSDLDAVYTATARYLGCDPAEVAFTASAGEGWWRAFSAVPLQADDRILVSTSEYQANAFGWLHANKRGVQVDVIPNDETGVVDIDAFVALLDERVKLVSLTMLAMTNGGLHPAAAVGQALKASGSEAIYLLDACQAAGQLPLDVGTLGCDFLVYTGRKFMRGPRGTGILYASSSVLDKLGPLSYVDGRSALWTDAESFEYLPGAQRFEMGEFGFGAKVGLGVATNYMLDIGIGVIADRVKTLADLLRFDLSAIPGVQVRDKGTHKAGIVTFTIDGTPSMQAQQDLASKGFNVSAPQMVRGQLDLGQRGIEGVVRAGVHYYNTEEEVARFCEAVADA